MCFLYKYSQAYFWIFTCLQKNMLLLHLMTFVSYCSVVYIHHMTFSFTCKIAFEKRSTSSFWSRSFWRRSLYLIILLISVASTYLSDNKFSLTVKTLVVHKWMSHTLSCPRNVCIKIKSSSKPRKIRCFDIWYDMKGLFFTNLTFFFYREFYKLQYHLMSVWKDNLFFFPSKPSQRLIAFFRYHHYYVWNGLCTIVLFMPWCSLELCSMLLNVSLLSLRESNFCCFCCLKMSISNVNIN